MRIVKRNVSRPTKSRISSAKGNVRNINLYAFYEIVYEVRAFNVLFSVRNPCRRDPCRNGGTCYTRDEKPYCACPLGYDERFCEKQTIG